MFYGLLVLVFAKLMGGRATIQQMLGTTSLVAVPHLLDLFAFIPCLGSLLGLVAFLWGLVIYVKGTAVANEFGLGKAVLAVLLPVIIVFLLVMALILIVIYGLSLIYAFFALPGVEEDKEAHIYREWSTSKASGVLVAATLLIAWLSEILVGAVEPVVEAVGVTEFFLGIIVIPLVGNVAEHLVGVQMAVKNRMELSLAISVGSSLQIALFVAPALVFISLLMGNPLTLVFNQFELISLVAAVLIAALVSLDGESNWLEGAQLLVVYTIIGLAFFYLPT